MKLSYLEMGNFYIKEVKMRVNLVVVAGNLTRNPELRYTPTGKAVSTLGVAINNDYTDSNGATKKDTVFIDIAVWGKQAEACAKYLTKGRPVYIEGRLKQDSWQNEEGQKRSKIKLVATKVQFIDYKKSTEDKEVKDNIKPDEETITPTVDGTDGIAELDKLDL
ncbi:hypothetical protein LCGC14_0305910 [marine sediment metagenome]|uniref:Single-stranded DNA-binding protein n=1 Tax=marine sediment metagenome TaxID=412755 RepID=A0A0F9U665_9ZZZZ